MQEQVIEDRELMNKCDCIALLYENDRDHLEFLKDNINKLPQKIPKILI